MEEEMTLGMKMRMVGWSAVMAAAAAAIEMLFLFLLAKGSSCENMASCVLATCGIGTMFLLMPVVMLMGAIIAAIRQRDMVWPILAAACVYAVVYLSAIVSIPRWQKIVPNVENAYSEFKGKHQEAWREHLYGQAEWLGNTTKPIFGWLENRSAVDGEESEELAK